MPVARIDLPTGRQLAVMELHLRGTYDALAEGYRGIQFTAPIVRQLQEEARRRFPDLPVHVSTPTSGPSSAAAEAPAEIACIGLLRSDPIDPVLEPGLYHSWLVVVWFQTDANQLPDKDALAMLRTLPWELTAVDHGF